MLKKKKAPVANLFEDTPVKLAVKSAKPGIKTKAKKAERAVISTSKSNKRKTRSLARDEEERVDIDADEDPGEWDVDLDATAPIKTPAPMPEPVKAKTKKKVPSWEAEVDHGDIDGDEPDSPDLPEDDDDDGMTTRKRPGTSLVASAPQHIVEAMPAARGKVSRVDQTKINSIIGQDADRLLTMLEDDSNTDSAVKQIKTRLLQTMIDLVPQLETSMRESNGRYGGHALNTTIQTIRELIIDKESAADRGAIGMSLIDGVVTPAMKEIATAIVEEMVAVLAEVQTLIPQELYEPVRRIHVESKHRIAQAINTQHASIKSEIIAALQR